MSHSTAFNSLPIELNKAIVHELDADKDIATYRLICRATNDAIDADKLSFWRAKYREKYAFKEGVPNNQLQRKYQRRSRLLRRGVRYDFFRGHKKHELAAIEILRELIVGMYSGQIETDEHGRPRCKNQTHLLNFIVNSRILMSARRAPQPSPGEPDWVHPTLAAVKLICAHFLFELEGAEHRIFALEESQHAVYQPTNRARLYGGPANTTVNMSWILHSMNFFRHHMMNEEAQTLYENISELPVTQKPSIWQERLQQGTRPLSRHWKGTYAFLDNPEIQKFRSQVPGTGVYIDKNIDEGKIQSLELDFKTQGGELPWPAVFEQRLNSLGHATAKPGINPQCRTANTRTGVKNIQFEGHGEDLDDEFNAIGWLNPLPPQAGIPGWQRITFMKHFMEDFDQLDQDNLWAYEGVVLPGGRIILGRWWYASEQVDFNNDYNGPFIWWAIDPDPEDEDESQSETEEE
ncbi:hypothetical protein EJ02DRAFT_343604 [Clathrospora elynae]|uniref:F-box domain-containing protein n=1 Tax=Clathrospora elynae TaxID=706981 RepID=A0A6A5SU21_9PLEO|nr:hypothetical protein EJ02DRAFT_343604 [Clathrospora elynae]